MGINITRTNGNLKRVNPTDDAVICMVMSGAAVAGKIALGECKQIYGTAALATLGITAANNPLAYKDIQDFYAKAGEGAELNFVLVSDATSLTNSCDKANEIAKKVIDFTNGRGVILTINKKVPTGYVATITNGLDNDVWTAITKLNEFIADYTAANIPFVAVLPALGYAIANIANVPDRSTLQNDSVAVNSICENNDGLISMGAFAGWLAKHQVHQNAGRVASGMFLNTAYFPDGTAADATAAKNAYAALKNKGILFPVKIGSRSGYYIDDDPTMTALSSDYSSISWNRVINKVHRIAFDTLAEHINDDVDVDKTTGKIDSGIASDWESQVEAAVKQQMINVGNNKMPEISGFKCTVDVNSNINNDEIDLALEVVRKGQSKTINVKLSYATYIGA